MEALLCEGRELVPSLHTEKAVLGVVLLEFIGGKEELPLVFFQLSNVRCELRPFEFIQKQLRSRYGITVRRYDGTNDVCKHELSSGYETRRLPGKHYPT